MEGCAENHMLLSVVDQRAFRIAGAEHDRSVLSKLLSKLLTRNGAIGLTAWCLFMGAICVTLSWSRRAQTKAEQGVTQLNIVKFVKKERDVHHYVNTKQVQHVQDFDKCSWGKANCNETQCCNAPGQQCYTQDSTYAQCRPSCTPQASDPNHWDGKWWECNELGVRSTGEAVPCANAEQNCKQSSCCAGAGLQCYEKNSTWSSCKLDCAPGGPGLTNADGLPWTCKTFGERSPPQAPWVSQQCSAKGKDCMASKCCQGAGQQCYMKNDNEAGCKLACNPEYEKDWSCKPLGLRTAPAPPPAHGKLAPWVLGQCSKPNEGCMDSRCCLGMDMQCYAKNEYWAICKQTCTPGKNKFDNNDEWNCTELGPRGYGLAVKGYPPLYCFAVFQIYGYEKDLINKAREKNGGIFACDEYSLLTADSETTIWGEKTTNFPGAPIVGSVDGTAGNTRLFVNAWKKVVEIGKFRNHAFTVKADPDAVFLPQKLRWHLGDFVGKSMFIVNCPKWNMIYGSLEVFSTKAMQTWSEQGHTCKAPENFGEDKYMTQCMDHLKVMRVQDWGVVGDKLCGTFSDCKSLPNAAFHPFKDTWSWEHCWQEAMNVIGE